MPERYAKIDPARALAMHARGLTQTEIARRLGACRVSVQRFFSRRGINCRTPERCRKNIARIARGEGYAALVQMRHAKARVKALYDWPGCGPLGGLESRVLAALEAGPATTHAVLERLGAGGVPAHRSGPSLALRRLAGRGLVVAAEGTWPRLWALAGAAAEAARRCRESEVWDE